MSFFPLRICLLFTLFSYFSATEKLVSESKMNVKAYQVAENMDLRLILREFEEFFNMKHATSLTNPNIIHVGMENGQFIVENDPTLVCTLQKSTIIFFKK